MKKFLENIFMCLVTFWKCYFPPPPTRNPPPHNRKTPKHHHPHHHHNNKKIKDQREKVKNQNHKQILIQKFQTRMRTRSVMGSRCDSRFVGSRCNDLGFFGFDDLGFDDLAGGATILGFFGFAISLSLSLSLSLCLNVWVLSFSLSFSLCTSPEMILR